MYSNQLGFSSSWKMLTRDKGWIKPLLVLTVVGWIPILGQIAIAGYAYEWARLTAWGVDSAPKQSKVNYNKVLTTGGRLFLVALTYGIALSIFDMIVFGDIYLGAAFPLYTGSEVSTTALSVSGGIVRYLLMLVVNLFMGTFISVAMMRATVYDSFAAGWRVDRIAQMISRDLGGFFHVYAVSLIGGIVSWVYSAIVALVVSIGLGAGIYATAMYASGAGEEFGEALVSAILAAGPGPVLFVVILLILLGFVGSVIGTAVELISVNATGQWFWRFQLERWGVSADPLPEGVPVVAAAQGAAPASGAAPQRPEGASAAPTAGPSAADVAAQAAPAAPSAEVAVATREGAWTEAKPEAPADGEPTPAPEPIAERPPIPLPAVMDVADVTDVADTAEPSDDDSRETNDASEDGE